MCRIHLETSSVLLRQLPVEYLKRPTNWTYAPYTADTAVGANDFVKVPEGEVTLGKHDDYPTFGWDNEYGKAIKRQAIFSRVYKMIQNCNRVPAFEATKYKIMNKEFLEFVEARGYDNRDLWTEEGTKHLIIH